MTENLPTSLPDPTGVPDLQGEQPVETVENLGDALRRLCQGAGKEKLDTLLIEEDRGLSSDGLVTTEIKYPFGFSAKLAASTVKSCLNHLTAPELKVSKRYVILKEGGRRFQVVKLARDCQVPEYPRPDTTRPVLGSWMSRMLPILPSRSGHLMFAGVYTCPEGFVGGDGNLLCWLEAPGLAEGAIIPKSLIARLPSGELQFHVDQEAGHCWAIEGDTIWAAPLVYGEFPEWWQTVFFEPDRSVVLERKDILGALRAIVSVEPHCHFVLQQEKQRVVLLSVRTAEARTTGNQGSRAQAAVAPQEVVGEDFTVTLDASRLLQLLDKSKGNLFRFGSEGRQDRLLVTSIDVTPTCRILVGGVQGYGAAPEEIE